MDSDLVFSGSAQSGYLLGAVWYFLMPAAAFLLLRRHGAARLFPVIVGAAVYFVTTRFSDLLANLLGFSQTAAVKALLAAELVCYLEEAGRWFALRTPLTNIRSSSAALCCGIGHGGLECWIRGIGQLRIYRIGEQIRSGGLSGFLADRSPERAAAVTGQLSRYADYSLARALPDMLESAVIFGVQIALTLLLFRKMQETDYQKRWLLLAILLHLCMNGSGWLASFAGSPLLSNAVGICCGTAVIAVVCRTVRIRECLDEILYPVREET